MDYESKIRELRFNRDITGLSDLREDIAKEIKRVDKLISKFLEEYGNEVDKDFNGKHNKFLQAKTVEYSDLKRFARYCTFNIAQIIDSQELALS